MSLLIVEELSKNENGIYTVKNISFTQQPLENIAIAGETGSGKTTLLKMIAGLVQPDNGEIKFENKKVKGPFEKLIPGHPGIVYLSQQFELKNNYYVHEILEYANQLTNEEANTLYNVCRIEHLLNRKTDQLSGGEKQRIALARLLISSPKLLFLDEPFSNLDAIHTTIIKSVLKDLREQLQISCIMISHDAPDILAWADTIIVMKDAKIIQRGNPEEIYHRPINEYCAALFGEYSLIAIEGKAKKLFQRPEDISIATASTVGSVKGLVTDVQFHGGYYLADVLNEKEILKVRIQDKNIKPGDTVYLALFPNGDWYI